EHRQQAVQNIHIPLQDDARWARGLGAHRQPVNAQLRLQLPALASALHALADLAARRAPGGSGFDPAAPQPPPPEQQAQVAVTATVVRYWCALTPQPTRAEQRACADALVQSGLWAAASYLLAPARAANAAALVDACGSGGGGGNGGGARAPAGWDEVRLWAAMLEGACRHSELAQFSADALHFRRAAEALVPSMGGVSWAWTLAAAERARDGATAPGLEGAAAVRLDALTTSALVRLAPSPPPSVPAERAEPAAAALVLTLSALETLCMAPHGLLLDPAGGGALGGALARAHAGVQLVLASWRAVEPATRTKPDTTLPDPAHPKPEPDPGAAPADPTPEVGAADDPEAFLEAEPAGGEEARLKSIGSLAQIQQRIKAVRCAAAGSGGKRD
ncbi:hypothetical protein T492DRAFT_851154, partial [Pavlovales sp. CCMP2436]